MSSSTTNTTSSSASNSSQIIKFNIGGTRYEVVRSLFDAYPESMLSKTISEKWYVDSKEIFIERDGGRFRYILDYLRDGKVYLSGTVSKKALLTDFDYYGIAIKEEQIHDDEAGHYPKSTIAAKKIVNIWRDAVTVFDAFESSTEKAENMMLNCNPLRGSSWLHCNEHLAKVGLRIVQEVRQ